MILSIILIVARPSTKFYEFDKFSQVKKNQIQKRKELMQPKNFLLPLIEIHSLMARNGTEEEKKNDTRRI